MVLHLSVLLSIVTEILFNDLVGKLVDLDILMVLQAFNLIEASAFLNHRSDSFNLMFNLKQLFDEM